MSAIINVDKKKRDDPHYRYKMPSIECKVESGGNGVKVVFPNLLDVAGALHRPADALLKFLGISRGAQTTFDAKDNKYYMMGNHLPNEIQDVVFEFIEKFVLCKHCRNPETQVVPGRHVKMHCGACGKDTSLDAQDEKIVKELVKASSQTKSETVKADSAAVNSAAAMAEADLACMLDLTAEHALPGEKVVSQDPTSALAAALKELKTLGKVGVQKQVISIKSEFGIREEDIPRLIFRGATSEALAKKGPFIGQLRDASFLLKTQLDNCKSAADKVASIQQTILDEAIRVINSGQQAKAPMLLKMLVDESIVEPSKVLALCKNLEATKLKKDTIPAVKEQLAVLVDWIEAGIIVDVPEEAAPEAEAAPEKAAKAKKSKKVVEA